LSQKSLVGTRRKIATDFSEKRAAAGTVHRHRRFAPSHPPRRPWRRITLSDRPRRATNGQVWPCVARAGAVRCARNRAPSAHPCSAQMFRRSAVQRMRPVARALQLTTWGHIAIPAVFDRVPRGRRLPRMLRTFARHKNTASIRTLDRMTVARGCASATSSDRSGEQVAQQLTPSIDDDHAALIKDCVSIMRDTGHARLRQRARSPRGRVQTAIGLWKRHDAPRSAETGDGLDALPSGRVDDLDVVRAAASDK